MVRRALAKNLKEGSCGLCTHTVARVAWRNFVKIKRKSICVVTLIAVFWSQDFLTLRSIYIGGRDVRFVYSWSCEAFWNGHWPCRDINAVFFPLMRDPSYVGYCTTTGICQQIITGTCPWGSNTCSLVSHDLRYLYIRAFTEHPNHSSRSHLGWTEAEIFDLVMQLQPIGKLSVTLVVHYKRKCTKRSN
jgi:hypothetical protein